MRYEVWRHPPGVWRGERHHEPPHQQPVRPYKIYFDYERSGTYPNGELTLGSKNNHRCSSHNPTTATIAKPQTSCTHKVEESPSFQTRSKNIVTPIYEMLESSHLKRRVPVDCRTIWETAPHPYGIRHESQLYAKLSVACVPIPPFLQSNSGNYLFICYFFVYWAILISNSSICSF